MGKRIDWTLEQLNKLPNSIGIAIESGNKYFYNGNHCKKDHLCPRSASSGKCLLCVRERATKQAREYRKIKGREKSLKYPLHGLSRSLEMWLYKTAKVRARKKSIEFTIKVTDIYVPNKCPILGMELSKVWGNVTQNSKSRSNKPSLDRIDSSKGYVLGNVEVLSYRANMLKGDGTIEEHLKIAAFLRKYSL